MEILIVIQILISAFLIGAILLQKQGGGLGATFGGSSSYHTKRGVEKGLFYLTIALASVFIVLSLAIVIY